MSEFQQNDLAQLRITLGDRSKDDRVDVTVEVYGKIPFFEKEPTRKLILGPFNVPIEEVTKVTTAVVGILPGPAAQVAQVALGVMSGFIAIVRRIFKPAA